MKLFAALLAIALPAGADRVLTCVEAATPAGFTLSCALPSVVTPPPPVEPPPPPPPVEPPPPPSDPCSGITDARFNQALAERLDPWGFFWRMQRSLKPEELACVRARKVPGFELPTPTGSTGGGGEVVATTGFNLERKGLPYRNSLIGGYTYQYSMATAAGESVELTILEVVGTPDSMTTTSYVRSINGTLSAPQTFGRHGKHTFISPGGAVTLYLTPSVSGELGVQRN
jgi:hypothetical protein